MDGFWGSISIYVGVAVDMCLDFRVPTTGTVLGTFFNFLVGFAENLCSSWLTRTSGVQNKF